MTDSKVRDSRAVVTVFSLEEVHTPSQTSQYGVCMMEEVCNEGGMWGVEEVGIEDIEGGV